MITVTVTGRCLLVHGVLGALGRLRELLVLFHVPASRVVSVFLVSFVHNVVSLGSPVRRTF
jgi:hypothetical protein